MPTTSRVVRRAASCLALVVCCAAALAPVTAAAEQRVPRAAPLQASGPQVPRATTPSPPPAVGAVRPPAHPAARVVVLRQPGRRAYEEVAEELRGRVRATVRVVDPLAASPRVLRAWLAAYRPHLVFAVGQTAYDVTRGVAGELPVVAALVYRHLAPEHAAVPSAISPDEVLAAFRAARPGLRTLGMLHGPGSAALLPAALAAARRQRLTLVVAPAATPAQALSRLRGLAPRVDGLWLPVDLELLTPQVVQYALGLQFRRRIPLLGATRRHVAQGALFALDHDPHEVGRRAAALANEILVGGRPAAPNAPPPAHLSLNLTTAQRVLVDTTALRRHANQVYQ